MPVMKKILNMVVDPGRRGAAVVFDGMTPLACYKFEPFDNGIDVRKWENFCREVDETDCDIEVYLEKIDAYPGQSIKTSATQFFTLGQQHAVLSENFPTIYMVAPQSWTAYIKRVCKREFGVAQDSKKNSQAIAKYFYTEYARQHTPKTKVHDGVADCLAINLTLNEVDSEFCHLHTP